MKRLFIMIISIVSSILIIVGLSSCGSSAETKLGMSKNEVMDLYDEKPTYEIKSDELDTYYWCSNDFIDLLDDYDLNLTDNTIENYTLIKNKIDNSSDLRNEISNLKFRFRLARFRNDVLIEYYYDFDHKFDLNDDYLCHLDKDVKNISLSKSKLEYYIVENNKANGKNGKAKYKIELIDYDNLTYSVEFSDGTLYKSYLKNDVEPGLFDEFETSKKNKNFDMMMYVDTDINLSDEFNIDIINSFLQNEKSGKIFYNYSGKKVKDFNFDTDKFIKGKCVGCIKVKNNKKSIMYWDTKIEYLPSDVDKDNYLGDFTTKTVDGVIYQGYKAMPYYKVVGVSTLDKSKYNIKEGAKIIESNALVGLKNCYALELPNTVLEIKDDAIKNNPNLISILIPESVTEIGNNNFTECNKLLEIVNASNVFTEEEAKNILVNGTSYYTSIDEYEKNGFIVKLDNVYGSYLVAKIEGRKNINDSGIEDGYYFLGTIKNTENIVLPTNIRYGKSNTIISEYKIYKYAFYNNEIIKNITIPSSVTEIGEHAFENCTNLEGITANTVLNINSYAFYNDQKLKNINLNNVNGISEYAFYNCKSIKEIELPSLTYLANNAFDNCINLETFDSELLTNIGSQAFNNCNKLDELNTAPLTNIDSQAFNNCINLVNINISDYELYIDDDAFNNCINLNTYLEDNIYYISSQNNKYSYLYKFNSNLTNLIIKNETNYIRSESFTNLTNLTNITFNDNISYQLALNILNKLENNNLNYNVIEGGNYLGSNSTDYFILINYDKSLSIAKINVNAKYIMENAFKDSSITSINIPSNIKYIGSYAFSNCDNLTNIKTFNDISYGDNVFEGCNGLLEVELQNITFGMFKDCNNLTKVTLDNIDTIPQYAFYNCDKLSDIDLSGIYTIYEYAFFGCSSITNINLANIGYINSYAFMDCSNLEEAILGNNLLSLGEGVFSGENKLNTLVLPSNINSLGANILSDIKSGFKIMIPVMVFNYIENAFGNVINLTDIYINGTMEDLMEYNFSLSYLELNQKIYLYSETEPVNDNYNYWHYVNNEIVVW